MAAPSKLRACLDPVDTTGAPETLVAVYWNPSGDRSGPLRIRDEDLARRVPVLLLNLPPLFQRLVQAMRPSTSHSGGSESRHMKRPAV